MAATIASAVAIVADDSEMDSNHNGLKRRQAEISEPEESKRQRTSSGKNSPENPLANKTEANSHEPSPSDISKSAQKAHQGKEARRKSAMPDDKQRSKRLFGALLGNLNAQQPNDRAVKRRADIEARRKAELAKQDNERLEDKQRQLRKLALHRKRKQIEMDEQDMHTRHRNLLDIANMLQTKAEPKLYYRPWDLLPDEEDQIDDQLEDAHTLVDEECAAFKIEKRKRLAELEGTANEATSKSEEEHPVAEAASDDPAKTAQAVPAESDPAVIPAGSSDDSAKEGESAEAVASGQTAREADAEKKDDVVMNDEKKGEVATNNEKEEHAVMSDEKMEDKDETEDEQVVEGDEDNVIY